MGEEISKEIAVDGVDVRELYGAQNVYREQIRALQPATCRVRQQVFLEALADARCRGGTTVLLRDGGSVGRFLIEEAQMRFANGAGKMALKLRKEQK